MRRALHNKTFMDFLKEQNIHIYSTYSDLKAVFVERFNRTLLDLIKRPMYIEGKACWLNHLENALNTYNNRLHGTTKMTPTEMSNNGQSSFGKIIIPPKGNKTNHPKFQVGDFVRVPDKRNLYSKGYTTNWNRELFKIHSINKTTPVTYTLQDQNKEIIQGKYYEQELLRSAFNFETNDNVLESMNIFHRLE